MSLTSQTISPLERTRGGGGVTAGGDRELTSTGLTWDTWKTGWIFYEGGRSSRTEEGLMTFRME